MHEFPSQEIAAESCYLPRSVYLHSHENDSVRME